MRPMQESDPSGLVAQGLSAFRGERLVLRDLSFAVPDGSALLLLGPNGSGKSTLLRVLAGLKRPDAGQVAWRGQDVREGAVAYLGHLDAVKPGLTVLENLALPARIGGTRDPAVLAHSARLSRPAPRVKVRASDIRGDSAAGDRMLQLGRARRSQVATSGGLRPSAALSVARPFWGPWLRLGLPRSGGRGDHIECRSARDPERACRSWRREAGFTETIAVGALNR
ncbi:MAG: ATP-binding cassette domain-containing protein, partial [Gemmatimonadaceae bacterium]|nr:ATP-binding cassette domain-containing protein [Acetobacteraceae bacterium]